MDVLPGMGNGIAGKSLAGRGLAGELSGNQLARSASGRCGTSLWHESLGGRTRIRCRCLMWRHDFIVSGKCKLETRTHMGKLAPTWENSHPHGKTCSMFERWHQSGHWFQKADETAGKPCRYGCINCKSRGSRRRPASGGQLSGSGAVGRPLEGRRRPVPHGRSGWGAQNANARPRFSCPAT